MVDFRRKLYKRGSSYETTLPMPLLFALDQSRKYNVVFSYDSALKKWTIDFEERINSQKTDKKKGRRAR